MSLFKDLFHITWKEYKKDYFDLNNFLFYIISFVIFVLLGGILGFFLWLVFLRILTSAGVLFL